MGKGAISFSTKEIKIYIDNCYLVLLSIYVLVGSINVTMFDIAFPYELYWIIRICLIVVVFLKHSVFQISCEAKSYLSLGTILIFGMVWINTGYDQLVDIALLIVGASNISYKRIIKICFWISIYVLIVSLFGTFVGTNRDLVYQQGRDGAIIVRHAWGMNYPTDFAAKCFFAMMMAWTLYGRSNTLLCLLSNLLLVLFLYLTCSARNSSGLLLIGSIFFTINSISKKEIVLDVLWAKIYQLIISCFVVFLALISVVATSIYNKNCEFLNYIERIVGRLELGNNALRKYGVSLWGQNISMQGFGMDENIGLTYGYDYVDDSYVLMLLQFGVIAFIFVLLLSVKIGYRCFANKQSGILLALCFIGIHSVIEQHFLEPIYNAFLLLIFADLSEEDKSCNDNHLWGEKSSVIKSATFIVLIMFAFTQVYRLRTFFSFLNGNKVWVYIFISLLFFIVICAYYEGIINYYTLLVVFFVMIVTFMGAYNIVLERKKSFLEENLKEESLVIEELLEIDTLTGVYVDDFTNVYAEYFPKIKKSLRRGNAYLEIENAVLITDNSKEYRSLILNGYRYVEISDIHGMYVKSEEADSKLQAMGIVTAPEFTSVQQIDLVSLSRKYNLDVNEDNKPILSNNIYYFDLDGIFYRGIFLLKMNLSIDELRNNSKIVVRFFSHKGSYTSFERVIEYPQLLENNKTIDVCETFELSWPINDCSIEIECENVELTIDEIFLKK